MDDISKDGIERGSVWALSCMRSLSRCRAKTALRFIRPSLFAVALLYAFLGFSGLLAGSTRVHGFSRRSANSTPVATVKNGSYSGVYSAQYGQDFFLGMPYAQRPIRLTNSLHLNSTWEGTRDATKYPPHCVGYGDAMNLYNSSEDCLFLNVIRPAGMDATADLPVAVWIHGGALVMGGTADKRYNMSFLVERSMQLGTPMIGVSMNYRLSVFGFPWGKEVVDAGVGNLGFKDQRLALRWVNENIGAFGGSKDKVTIFGESSGAESTSAQTYAYNGRDDGLFRAAMGESGFAGPLMRLPGGLNNTDAEQFSYDSLVLNTSCASTVKTKASLDCLRGLPFSELDGFLNRTAATILWGPVMDGDFLANYPSTQLREGKFPKIPLLIGVNSDEGTFFSAGRHTDTDADMRANIALMLPPNAQATTGKTNDQLIDELLAAYPDSQDVGVPGLDKFAPITKDSDLSKALGLQYRRASAVLGDYFMHYARRRTSMAWSNYNIPSWSYRFDVLVNGVPEALGATHFMEVAFVMYNLNGDGYDVNPFANASADYLRVAKTMASAWVNFVVTMDPNGKGTGLAGLQNGEKWSAYEAKAGENLVFSVDGNYLEKDTFRREGMAWMADHSLNLFGN